MTYLATVGLRNVIVRNTLVLALSQASIYLIPLVTTPYVARVLGAEALGLYALGMTIVSFFGLFNGLGLPQAAVRFVAVFAVTSTI